MLAKLELAEELNLLQEFPYSFNRINFIGTLAVCNELLHIGVDSFSDQYGITLQNYSSYGPVESFEASFHETTKSGVVFINTGDSIQEVSLLEGKTSNRLVKLYQEKIKFFMRWGKGFIYIRQIKCSYDFYYIAFG